MLQHEDVEFRFCPVCGAPLKSMILKDKEPARLVCTHCQFVFYLDPKLVACTIVEMASSPKRESGSYPVDTWIGVKRSKQRL
jgi:NADH pyrophosphatase NudC (nudix superfamily)